MTSGWSYQVAHPLFVVSGHPRSQRARAPPRTARTVADTGPEHAKGPAEAPASPGRTKTITRQVGRTGVKV